MRNAHALLNSLKRLQCLVCRRETPGFDIPLDDLRVLDNGEKILFADKNIVKQLKKSKVLAVSIRLDFNFSTANQCINGYKFSKGVCVDCSKYFKPLSETNNDIKPKFDYADYLRKCR